MPVVYEYWQHRATDEVWAVKVSAGCPMGATQISRADMNEELLPYLAYRTDDAADLQKRQDDFKRIDARKVA